MKRHLLLLLAVSAGLAPIDARAANGNKPRIPVVWSSPACMQVIDRSATAEVRFDYEVPEEDLGQRTQDEVADSRTHQFFAFSRLDFAAVNSSQKLPRWITQADIDRSALVDPSVIPQEIARDDILEFTGRFEAGDWMRITLDDARVPISDAQAAMGVTWDLTDVPPGSYTIWSYTWEPLLNLWSPRAGLVKVIASAAQADLAGPSIVLLPESAQIVAGERHRVLGCADVAKGSTVTLEWGVVEGSMEPAWRVLLEDEPIDSGALDLDFVPPGEAGGESVVRLRATVTDPEGRTHVAYSPGTYAVLPGAGDGDGEGGSCRVIVRGARPATLAWLGLAVAMCLRQRRRRATLHP